MQANKSYVYSNYLVYGCGGTRDSLVTRSIGGCLVYTEFQIIYMYSGSVCVIRCNECFRTFSSEQKCFTSTKCTVSME